MSPELLSSYKGDKHRVRFICRAVSSRPWSHPVSKRVALSGFLLQQLYGETETTLQLYIEGAKRATTNGAGTSSRRMEPFFGIVGQIRFERSQFSNSEVSRSLFPWRSYLDIAGCFNCDDKEHMVRDCFKLLNSLQSRASKIGVLKEKRRV